MSDLLAKWSIRLYAVGVALCVPLSYSFFLCTYGRGGGPECRGRIAMFARDFPAGVNHILYDHGAVTPISKQFYDRIIAAQNMELTVYFVALPFLLAGLAAYWRMIKGHGWRWQMRLWLALFFPRRSDPYLTNTAKLWFLFTFAALFLFTLTDISICSEESFLDRISLTYIVTGVLSLICCFCARRWFASCPSSPGGQDQQDVQADRPNTTAC